ncbi:hypothetical protein SEA_OTTAWA_92 [Arthrobacter phage Ottawa]|nr:hypothetical protein SEA_KHARCHO_92 [Arthrobacter phage Kharcho]WIC89324.1 hypothetical protein SEA_OTTAWA_92 [Arthrobacter phage Ottawa]
MNKHRIELDEISSVRHQRGAAVSHFAIIEGTPFIWVEEETGFPTRRVKYRTYSSGETVAPDSQYLTSATDPLTGITAHLYKES